MRREPEGTRAEEENDEDREDQPIAAIPALLLPIPSHDHEEGVWRGSCWNAANEILSDNRFEVERCETLRLDCRQPAKLKRQAGIDS